MPAPSAPSTRATRRAANAGPGQAAAPGRIQPRPSHNPAAFSATKVRARFTARISGHRLQGSRRRLRQRAPSPPAHCGSCVMDRTPPRTPPPSVAPRPRCAGQSPGPTPAPAQARSSADASSGCRQRIRQQRRAAMHRVAPEQLVDARTLPSVRPAPAMAAAAAPAATAPPPPSAPAAAIAAPGWPRAGGPHPRGARRAKSRHGGVFPAPVLPAGYGTRAATRARCFWPCVRARIKAERPAACRSSCRFWRQPAAGRPGAGRCGGAPAHSAPPTRAHAPPWAVSPHRAWRGG